MKKPVNIHRHNMPQWFRQCNFGIFIHWGLYSVPAFAPTRDGDFAQILREKPPEFLFANQPYAEWYQNSMSIPGSPANVYHREHFGDTPYEAFAQQFRRSAKNVDPESWAESFAKAGAGYVVLVTKHHDGFLMFDSRHKNPNVPDYQLDFDFTGALAEACRKRGLRFGVYYSSLLDWSFTKEPILRLSDLFTSYSHTKEYYNYCNNHWMELIERYKPDILWSDIGYPPDKRIEKLFQIYYEQVPEGVVNDRWGQIPSFMRLRLMKKLLDQLMLNFVSSAKSDKYVATKYYDYRTTEYTVSTVESDLYYEMCRGMDKSFGFNRQSNPADFITAKEVRSLIAQVSSKKGRLLLNVGPDENGTIPPPQQAILDELAADR